MIEELIKGARRDRSFGANRPGVHLELYKTNPSTSCTMHPKKIPVSNPATVHANAKLINSTIISLQAALIWPNKKRGRSY
jgi:hypothetical protein